MRARHLTSTTLLALGLPAAALASPAARQAEVEQQIRGMLNASGPAIDRCVERHAVEYPSADGKAEVVATVLPTGVVARAAVETALEGARNLRLCLEQVARAWRFPSGAAEPHPVRLALTVRKGVRFHLPDPAAKPGPAAQGARPPSGDDGFLRFSPGAWAGDPSVSTLPGEPGGR
jgi:hypothetical protein